MKKLFSVVLATILGLSLFPVISMGEITCSAQGAVVMEPTSEELLYQKNADLCLPQASTTKIMTALLVLEKASLEEFVTVSASAAGVEGSQMGLQEGDRLTVKDLLYILLLKSGNDAAEVLAEGLWGSVSECVDSMNRKAAELGLKNTQFQNPHGLPSEGHYTTARDLARLTAAALEDPLFCRMVSQKTVKLSYKNAVISNSNKLLNTCEGVFGVKTGFTKKAGRCLVSAAERDGVRLICVTLNDPDDWRDHANLYDECFARIQRTEIVPRKGYVTDVPVLGVGNVKIQNSQPLYVITVDGEPLAYTLIPKTIPRVFAPVEQGKTLGYLEVQSATGRCFSKSPLNTLTRVEQKKEERTLWDSFFLKLHKLWWTLIS